MNNLKQSIDAYLFYCSSQKRLDKKTTKAYRIDLYQFADFIHETEPADITIKTLESYIAYMHSKYQPKTVKRKIASLKALFHYYEYKDIITQNPFNKLRTRFREPVILPKAIPLNILEQFIQNIYNQQIYGKTTFQRKNAICDAAVCEMLFATGMRISELCALRNSDVDLQNGTIRIYGKRAKERILQISNPDVLAILKTYKTEFSSEVQNCQYFFVTQHGKPLSDQSIRRMMNKYATAASIDLHITPHMFRHTFATSLLDADVDIRCIQELLGHSSINTTEIYTHVATAKQRDILSTKHPRKSLNIHSNKQ